MLLKERERELFQRWKVERGYDSFITDGVFDEVIWDKQPMKVTFVLKEANWENGTADLCQFLLGQHKGSYWKTWNNIARWSQALLAGGECPRYVSKQDKTDWLSRVSFLNLKKVGGGCRTNNHILREYAAKDAGFLWEQLSLYAPDIIICCGWWVVADILYQDVLPKEQLGEWKQTINGFHYFQLRFEERKSLTPVVSFYHPQRIASHSVFQHWYEDMKKIGDELLTRPEDEEDRNV